MLGPSQYVLDCTKLFQKYMSKEDTKIMLKIFSEAQDEGIVALRYDPNSEIIIWLDEKNKVNLFEKLRQWLVKRCVWGDIDESKYVQDAQVFLWLSPWNTYVGCPKHECEDRSSCLEAQVV